MYDLQYLFADSVIKIFIHFFSILLLFFVCCVYYVFFKTLLFPEELFQTCYTPVFTSWGCGAQWRVMSALLLGGGRGQAMWAKV